MAAVAAMPIASDSTAVTVKIRAAREQAQREPDVRGQRHAGVGLVSGSELFQTCARALRRCCRRRTTFKAQR